MKSYAGIGSRSTPQDVLALMVSIGAKLAEMGFTLRSGGAQGADQAFAAGAISGNPDKRTAVELFLPWRGFEDQDWNLVASHSPSNAAAVIAARYHPAWDKLSRGGKLLQARNTHQVLGADCASPVSFVICWTPDAKGGGGTGQAIRLAKANGIPVFDLADASTRDRLQKFVGGDCPNCGANPCYSLCHNSPDYYSPEREREDTLRNDSMSDSEWLSEAHRQYEQVHGEPYVS